MKVLVIGSGGREHALVWKLKQSPQCTEIWCAPGNRGIAELARTVPFNLASISNMVSFAKTYKFNLVVVGPEAPLAEGMADACRVDHIPVVGPNAKAARIESSKIFARELMKKYGIPSPRFESFSEPEKAKGYVRNLERDGKQVVVKADGLAGGKGAIVTAGVEEADRAIDLCLQEKAFGEAGTRILIEERLSGPELSILALTDGKKMVILPPAQDHKPAGEGDTGPNTGGMGAYSPVPMVDERMMETIESTILKPTLRGLEEEGSPYSGILYAGLMIADGKPYVIEFNCRLGDPESQAVLPAVEEDLLPLFLEAAKGELKEDRVLLAKRKALCVVMASKGYPGAYEKGKGIEGLAAVEQAMAGRALVFHAGTAEKEGKIVTAGGRVLGVTGLGATFEEASANAYEVVSKISFEGATYRRDIGYRLKSMA